MNDSSKEKETLPIKTLDDLLCWSTANSSGIPCDVKLPIRNAWSESTGKRRTIMCHDMRGGYLADRFTAGTRVQSHEAYVFYHWPLIHAFIYFSHNFVTVPPVGWTKCAHRNNVPCFGTFITEWDDGKEIWGKLLADHALLNRVAKLLVDIADHYGFDGWLVNIENSIEPKDVSSVITFLRQLHQRSRLMVDRPQHPLIVIWYDSITIKGDLKWQNCLNEENMKFFHVVDGIFLNYNWTFCDLDKAKKTAGAYRKYDVFVGVDVFGRGCYGGGGWNTYKALEVIQKHDMSVALFAPGWVLECNDPTMFMAHQNNFWQSISSYLPKHKILSLPINTDFCTGHGKKRFARGCVVETCDVLTVWMDLGKQDILPSLCQETTALSSPEMGSNKHGSSLNFLLEDGWNGGGCLEIPCPVSCKNVEPCLFRCDILLTNSLCVEMTLKSLGDAHYDCALVLLLKKRLVNRHIRLLCQIGAVQANGGRLDFPVVYPREVLRHGSVSTEKGWITYRYFLDEVIVGGNKLEGISFRIERKNDTYEAVSVMLGELSVR